MRHLSALRLVFLLLCLVGTQHAVLVHPFEHLPAQGIASLVQGGQGGSGDAVVCADCLAAHASTAIFSGAAPAVTPSGLAHVRFCAELARACAAQAPEPRAHGPPPVTLS